jgi:3-hydroxyisobutyrate dehydrogenase-like beta-hydroxyacid dehydrogenase
VDHTTNSPILVRKIHWMITEKGAAMLDAPVSGGVTGAQNGTLTIQVGGDPEALGRCRTVLSAMASTVLRVGDIGAGCICKITHNCAVFSANLAMMECLTLGVKAGVDASTLVELFQKSGIGRNHDLQVSLPVTLFRGVFEPRFALQTAAKDMGLALELARACDLSMPVTDLCAREMSAALARGWAAKDHSIYLTLQEERAGVQIRLTSGPQGKPKEGETHS